MTQVKDPARLAAMLALVARGETPRQIAAALGFSRNVVIGALWRHRQRLKAQQPAPVPPIAISAARHPSAGRRGPYASGLRIYER